GDGEGVCVMVAVGWVGTLWRFVRACISGDLLLVQRGMSVPWKDPSGSGLPRQGTTKGSYSLRTCCSLICRDRCCSATDVPRVKHRCTWRYIVADLILVLSYTRTRRWRQPSQSLVTTSNRLCFLRLWWPWGRGQASPIRCLDRG